jgi:hypothetical protein
MGRDEDAIDKAIEGLTIRQVMPPQLAQAVAAQEKEMVIAALRGNMRNSTSRTRAAAEELKAILARQGWKPEQLSDAQIGEVIDRLAEGAKNAEREYRADGRRAGVRPRNGRYQALAGATAVGDKAFGPIPEIVDAAERYAAEAEIDFRRQAYKAR